MRKTAEYTIWDAVTPQTVTSSTDATPIVVTKASHGFATGDLVIINGHTTNITANGIFRITRVDANSFSLQDVNTNANVAGFGGGAGSGGVMAPAPKIINVNDYRNAMLQVTTSGTATLTVKVAASLGKPKSAQTTHGDTPNFGATQTSANPYSFVQIIDLVNASNVDGSTGITTTATDIHKLYEINVNALSYFTVIPTAWTAGTITVKAKLYDNE